MKYYIVSDTHSYFTLLKKALTDAGYFEDQGPHKLVILGDLFDRGDEAKEMQDFVLDLMSRDEVILIRGNHEDMFVALATKDNGQIREHHLHNGTYSTALQLTDLPWSISIDHPQLLAKAMRDTPAFTQIIPAMRDYYETAKHIFVHGWIPCMNEEAHEFGFMEQWRTADKGAWEDARWVNGIEAAGQGVVESGKTICCGHFHASYGHAVIEGKGTEFGQDADYSPYYAPGIIALDACTALSGQVNCIVLEDEELL